MLEKYLKKYSAWSMLFLRVAIGVVFLVHGLGKLLNVGPTAIGVQNFSGYLASLGVPLPLLAAWIVTLAETFGGLAILFGLFTREAALLLSLDMLTAFFLVHRPNGFAVQNGGYEMVLLLFFGCLTLLFSGPGEKCVLMGMKSKKKRA